MVDLAGYNSASLCLSAVMIEDIRARKALYEVRTKHQFHSGTKHN